MSESQEQWYWVDTDGVVNAVGEWELVSNLKGGSLPAYTLVWRRGWANWYRASTIAQLRDALGAADREPITEPKLDADRVDPPPPPLEEYDARRTRDAAAALMGSKPVDSKAPPPPPGGGSGRGAGAAAALIGKAAAAAPPPPRARPPMPTFVEEPIISQATLRPPGAVPPPPKAVPPGPSVPPDVRDSADPIDGIEEVHAEPEPESAPVHAPAGPDIELPTQPVAALQPLPDPAAESAPPPPAAPVAPTSADSGTGFPVAMIVMGVLALGLLGVIAVLVFQRFTDDTPKDTVVRAQPSAAAGAPRAKLCRLDHQARLLAPALNMRVRPALATRSDGRIVVGIAESQQVARGLQVTPDTLQVAHLFQDQGTDAIRAVIPIVDGNSVQFKANRAGGALDPVRSITANMEVGVRARDLVVVRDGKESVIWSEAGSLSAPQVAAAASGYAIVTRQGGQDGDIQLIWLNQDGEAQGEPTRIPTKPGLVGKPSVATNDEGVAIAFAWRSSTKAAWGISLASAKNGEIPQKIKRFQIPDGGPGEQAISPSIGGYGGRWLLQWTEGSSGSYRVRVQTLGPDLVPVGDPIDVSPKGANAGQGVVWVQGEHGLALFIVRAESRAELWGASLACQ